MKAKFTVEGMDKLQKSLKTLGKVPQKHVTAAARKGMNPVLKDAKANAPYDTGALKKGMILKGERSRYKGKKVFDVVFDDKMNDVFRKPIQDPGSRGGKGNKTSYYPISQEYGYFAGNGKFIPGFRFIHDSLATNAQRASKIMVETMTKKIEQEAQKVGLK